MAGRERFAEVADECLPPGWDDSPSRRDQILAVIDYFLDTPQEMSTSERRNRAQKRVAEEQEVTINTVQSKCGRETWEDHVSSSEYQREHFDKALEEMEDLLRNSDDMDLEVTDQPAVWIEKTEIEGRTYKKEGELQLGDAIYSPTQDKQGHDRYAEMREADPGDLVLHLLQDKEQIVGISVIESELETDFEGLPEFGWTEEQAGYRRWLTDYRELDEPIDIYEDVLDNRSYESRLREIREKYSNIIFTKNLALVQGGYLTQCPPELLAIISAESDELEAELADRGYPIKDLAALDIEPRDEYDSLDDAVEDIRNRLDRAPEGLAWFHGQLSEAIVADWSSALAGYKPSDEVSADTAAKFDQLRAFYESIQPELEEKADALGVGSLGRFSPAKTLFLGYVRAVQDQMDVSNGALSQPRLNSVLRDTYTLAEREQEQPTEETLEHPLLERLDDVDSEVHTFSAPPEYWLTAVQYGAVSFESDLEGLWESVDPGAIAFLHTQTDAASDAADDQPNGIFGVGVIGKKSTKAGQWWKDESQGDPYSFVIGFAELYLTSDLDSLHTSKRVEEIPQDELDEQIEALTTDQLGIERIQQLCENANGRRFPADDSSAEQFHSVFSDEDGSPDHERPRALLEALADRLTQTGTINAHAPFDGTVPTDPLDGLHYPGNQKEEIVQQIEAALRSGKHIILTGPPGTGKTEIARRVCSHLASEYPQLYSDFQLTTATADWSTFDTVGGYMPESSEGTTDRLAFTPGVVLNRLKDRQTERQVNEPIIIDELNRADIDKAFGQLFTLLSDQSVQLPFTREGEEIELLSANETDRRPAAHQYVVPESWRIFATMNTYDKTSLYEMSYAFMRRFAFIRVGAPSIPEDDGKLEEMMHDYAQAWGIPVAERDRGELQAVGRVWREMNAAVEDRAIGPAIVKDIVEYINENETIPLEDRLTRAVISYVFPQLEGVPKREQIVRQIASVPEIDGDGLSDAASEMLQVSIRDNE